MTAENADPNFQHPKCYANLHGGCSKKISGEHYFSHSMIKLYTFDDPQVKIMHNHGFGIPKGVSPKNFVVNALCVNHNTALSGTDAAALQFATFVRRIALDFLGGAGEWGGPEEITISGDNFERWALKLLLNHAAGKAFSANQGKIHSPIPPAAIDYLLGKQVWPKGLGLCVAGDPKNESLKFDPFTKLEHTLTDFWGAYPILWNSDKLPGSGIADHTFGGGIVELNGFSFGLSVLPIYRGYTEANGVKNWFRGCVERPDYIEWNLDGVGKRINFTWNNPSDHLYIVYTMFRSKQP
ncbi:hypothetical protein [Mycobacterium sp. SMC-4]|uniref:hypothetical protein n=1 Tax=Mycobacterium sp. SMC-4 TaxID=2857059 RepID=UPI003D02077D